MKVMNSEGYHFQNQEFKVRRERVSNPRIEVAPLFERGSKSRVQTISRKVGSQETSNRVHFDTPNRSDSFLTGLGKKAQILTLATIEVLASATSVVAGGVIATGTFDFPFAIHTLLAMGAPIPLGVIFPITLSVVGIGLIFLGMKRIGAAAKRMRTLFKLKS